MFFVASKIFWFVAEPVSLAIVVGVLGLLLGFTRFARAGRALTAGAIIVLAAGLLTPLGALILRPLEDRFPPPPANISAPAGIIVLGGALDTEKSEARGQVFLTADAARMTAGIELARRYPSARLVFTGGAAGLLIEERAEAIGARKLWLSLGVPEERMTFEKKSRNTWENALFTRNLVKPKPGETWLLVTSAWHMPRSVGIFRRLGFDVIPYPVAYRTFGDERDFLLPTSMIDKVIMLDYSVREWVGLLAYRLAGKTNALFPAP
jgi:uncharacterized SAM-binding protein YcdF (DUF218 family)